MIHKLPFINHFHAQYEVFQLFCLDTSLSKRGMLKFKPCYKNQVYLAHYAKHKTLTHRGALWRYRLVAFRCSHGEFWSLLVSWSLKKWWQMYMCLVLEWLTGLFASFMALSLSHKSRILVNWHPKSWRVCVIQSSWAQHAPATTYSALVVERAKQFCFLELQDTRDRPSNWHVPEVFF